MTELEKYTKKGLAALGLSDLKLVDVSDIMELKLIAEVLAADAGINIGFVRMKAGKRVREVLQEGFPFPEPLNRLGGISTGRELVSLASESGEFEKEFRDFLAGALGEIPSSGCLPVGRTGLELFRKYRNSYLRLYFSRRPFILESDEECVLDDWFCPGTFAERIPPEGIIPFEEWIMKNAPANPSGMGYLMIGAFADFVGRDVPFGFGYDFEEQTHTVTLETSRGTEIFFW